MTGRPIAILGATSQIALDFIRLTAGDETLRLCLYARRPEAVEPALRSRGVAFSGEILPIARFSDRLYGGIVNFVGIGDPSRTEALGAGILAATREWDDRALAHLGRQPDIPYVFLSSGAVYGDAFSAPVSAASAAIIPINSLGASNWYTLAKLVAECEHRARPGATVVDIRVFNYITRNLDLDGRFLMTDMIRAIEKDAVFETSDVPIVRDYLHPADLVALIKAGLGAPLGTNVALDAYSRAPITKAALLDLMADAFGLRHTVVPHPDIVNATGLKPHYYSLNHVAARFGYQPSRTSAEAIVEEVSVVLRRDVVSHALKKSA